MHRTYLENMSALLERSLFIYRERLQLLESHPDLPNFAKYRDGTAERIVELENHLAEMRIELGAIESEGPSCPGLG